MVQMSFIEEVQQFSVQYAAAPVFYCNTSAENDHRLTIKTQVCWKSVQIEKLCFNKCYFALIVIYTMSVVWLNVQITFTRLSRTFYFLLSFSMRFPGFPGRVRTPLNPVRWLPLCQRGTTDGDGGLYSRLVHRLVLGNKVHPTQQWPPQTWGLQRERGRFIIYQKD